MNTRDLSSSQKDSLYRAASGFLCALADVHGAEQEATVAEKLLRETMKECEVQGLVMPDHDQVIVAEAADNWTSKVKVYGDVVTPHPL